MVKGCVYYKFFIELQFSISYIVVGIVRVDGHILSNLAYYIFQMFYKSNLRSSAARVLGELCKISKSNW